MSATSSENSLGIIVRDISRLFRQAFNELVGEKNIQISHGEYRMLTAIASSKPKRQSDLAATLGIEPMTVSAALNRLQMRELVDRIADPDDRRVKVIATTASAISLLAEVEPIAEEVVARATRGIRTEELKASEEALCRIRANLASGW